MSALTVAQRAAGVRSRQIPFGQVEYTPDTDMAVVMDADGSPLHVCDCRAMIDATLAANPGAYLATGAERDAILAEVDNAVPAKIRERAEQRFCYGRYTLTLTDTGHDRCRYHAWLYTSRTKMICSIVFVIGNRCRVDGGSLWIDDTAIWLSKRAASEVSRWLGARQ